MNLFGIEFKFMKNGYVNRKECHFAMEDLKNVLTKLFDTRIDDLKAHLDNRFNDFKDFLNK